MTRLRNNPWAVLVFLCLGFFMVLLDVTIVNIAIPSMIDGLKAGLDQVIWVLNAYTLTFAVLLITAGRLGDRFGQRNLFTIGLALFILASAACGLSQDPNQLIVARVMQAVGGALLTPQTLAILTTIFPPARRGAAFGVWGGIAGLATIAGPTVGGLLVTYLDWRWIFFINAPIAFAAIMLIPRLVDESKAERTSRRFDLPGAVLATGGVLALVDGFLAAARNPWGSFTVVGPLVGGVVALLALVVVESRSTDPLIPLKFFQNRTRVSANIATAAMASGMFGMFFLLTLYLQQILGYSPLKAGLAYVPFGLGMIVGIGLSTAFIERVGARSLISVSFGVIAAALWMLGRIGIHGSYVADLLPSILMMSIGMGAAFPAVGVASLHQVSQEDAGLGSAVQNTVLQVGGSLGLAVLVTVAVRSAATNLATGSLPAVAATHGYALAFRVAAGALVGAALIAVALVPGKVQTAETAVEETIVEPEPEAELVLIERK